MTDSRSVADELSKLADLRDRGILTEEEFSQQKVALLGQAQQPRRAPAPEAEYLVRERSGEKQATTQANLRSTGAAWLLIPAGLLAAIGSLLPWWTESTGIVNIARNGFQLGAQYGFSFDGLWTLLLGLLVALIGAAALARSPLPGFIRRSPIVAGIVIVLDGVNALNGIIPANRQLREQISGVSASIGYGLALVIAGGAIAVVGGLTAWVEGGRLRRPRRWELSLPPDEVWQRLQEAFASIGKIKEANDTSRFLVGQARYGLNAPTVRLRISVLSGAAPGSSILDISGPRLKDIRAGIYDDVHLRRATRKVVDRLLSAFGSMSPGTG